MSNGSQIPEASARQVKRDTEQFNRREKDRYRKRKKRIKEKIPTISEAEAHKHAMEPFTPTTEDESRKSSHGTISLPWKRIIAGAGTLICTGILIHLQAEATGGDFRAWGWAIFAEIMGPILILMPIEKVAMRVCAAICGIACLSLGYGAQHESVIGESSQKTALIGRQSEAETDALQSIQDQIDTERKIIEDLQTFMEGLPQTYVSKKMEILEQIKEHQLALKNTSERKSEMIRTKIIDETPRIEAQSWIEAARRILLTVVNLILGHITVTTPQKVKDPQRMKRR